MLKIPTQEYTAELKELPVKQVRNGRGIAAAAPAVGAAKYIDAGAAAAMALDAAATDRS